LIAKDIVALRTSLEVPYAFFRTFQILTGKLTQFGSGIGRDSSTKSMVKKSMIGVWKALTTEDGEVFAEAAEKDLLCFPLREPLRPLRLAFFVFSLTLLAACQAASSGQTEPVSAGALTKEYQASTIDARRKYDGREITVKGLTVMTAMMPPSGSDQGLVFLEEKGANPARRVACWFSKDQVEQFSKITSGQFITVKGIFNGEAGAELKFCKLVKIE
jgi:hypothetical protein